MANNDRTNTTDERATAAEQSSTSTRLSQAEQNALQFAQNETAAEPTPVDPATGQPVAEPTSQAAVPDVPETITPDADNVVRLPQGVSIDEIRLDGNNLVLVQPDGSTVTILNAALKVPTFLIGDVEIPELALAAALQANGIDVAAGPDGALTVVSAASQSGGGGFNTPNGDIGDAGPVIDLLPPTALQFGTLERRELFPSIRENDFPELSIVSLGAPPGQVNESALASGSGGGTTSTLGNILVDPGDDGLGSLVVTNASGVSVDVTNGGSIQGVYGELIVTPNGDGTYSLEYVLTTNTIDHANAGQTGADDVVTDTFDFVVTDGNGDTASDELTVTITDDGPAIDLAPAEESEIVLDETDNDADDGDVGGLLADLTVPGSALFTETATPGADGEQSKVYSLVLNAGATGLTDTLSGEPVVLSEEGGAIVGRTETGGDEVFRISVDANTGDITVSQSRALFHDQNPGSDAEAHDESLTPEVMNSGLVSLNVVLTDGDGDTAIDTAELGALIKFQDDGPAIGLAPVEGGEIVLDETDNDADDGDVGGLLAAVTVSSSALFTETATAGADGAQPKVYSLVLNAGATGLTDTLSGEAVVLSEEGGAIVGRTQTGGDEVFRISVDADTGDITVSQSRALFHDQNPGSDAEAHDESLTPEVMSSGLVSLKVVLTDGDGDTASDTAELGALIKFEDDGPVLGEVTAVAAGALTLDESPLPGAGDGVAIQTLALAGNFAAVNYGTDGAGTTTYGFALSGAGVPVASGLHALNSVDGTFTQGTEITLSLSADGQTITGSADGVDYFTIAVDDTGTVTFTQLNNIWHGDAGDADDAEVLSLAAGTLVVQQTVTDQDGDSVTADLDLSAGVFVIEDDGPTNNAHTASETVHEDALDNYDPLAVLPGIWGSTGNDEGGKTTTAVFTYATIASLVSFGADGAGAVVLNTDPSLEGVAITGVTSQGDTLAWHVDGNVIQGVASDGRVVFTITQTAGTGTTDPTDDKFTFELLDQVDHIPLNTPSGDDDASALIDISNAFRAFDGDGDSIVLDAGLSVAVENDVPVNIDPTPMIIANSGSGAASAKLDYYLNVGADEGGTVTFTGFANGAQLTQSDGVSTVTTSGGLPVYLYGTGTGVLVASSEASFAFDPNTYDPENPPSHVVFHIVLNPDDVVEGNDTYSVEFFQELQDGSGIDFTGLGFTRAGNNTFQTTNGPDIEGVSHDLLFSAFDGSSVATVNTDSSEVSVDNNGAGINDGEGIRIDFVTSASGLGLSGNYEAYDFGTTYNGNGFSFVIAQIGNAGSTDIVLRIYDTDGDDPSNTPANTNQESATIQENHVDELADDTQDTITDIQVNGVSLNLVVGATTNVGGTNYTVILDANNDWVVQNLQLGDQVKVFSANGYNRIELENYDDNNNGDGFSIKNFGIDVTQQGSDVSMDFDVLVTDQDGDTSTGTIGLTVTPDDGTISGTTGSDYLVGGPDDDLLIGGDGADVLIGGEGQNTYDLTDTDNAVDTVVLDPSALTGMNPDEIIGFSSEDVVDLTELVSLSTTSGENVGDFVRLNPGDGKELQVDADGTAGGDDWVTVATFDVPQTPASIKILYDDDGSDTSGTV